MESPKFISESAYSLEIYSCSVVKFIKFFTQTHFMVVAYKNDPELSQKVPVDVEAYIKEKKGGTTATTTSSTSTVSFISFISLIIDHSSLIMDH